MKISPYIGITGFMRREEAETVLPALPADSNRQIMVGVLASLKTISGQTNSRPGRYPKVDQIAEIFMDHPRVLNLIHYHTSDQLYLAAQLDQIEWLGGKNFHGVQLNLAWPNPHEIMTWLLGRHHHPQRPIVVLQCGQKVLEEYAGDPLGFAHRAKDYEGIIDYLLLDPSGGEGKLLSPAALLPFLRAIRDQFGDSLLLGVAGGLCPLTAHVLGPLAAEFPDLSTDAEGKLRENREDKLQLKCARRLINEIAKIFKPPMTAAA